MEISNRYEGFRKPWWHERLEKSILTVRKGSEFRLRTTQGSTVVRGSGFAHIIKKDRLSTRLFAAILKNVCRRAVW